MASTYIYVVLFLPSQVTLSWALFSNIELLLYNPLLYIYANKICPHYPEKWLQSQKLLGWRCTDTQWKNILLNASRCSSFQEDLLYSSCRLSVSNWPSFIEILYKYRCLWNRRSICCAFVVLVVSATASAHSHQSAFPHRIINRTVNHRLAAGLHRTCRLVASICSCIIRCVYRIMLYPVLHRFPHSLFQPALVYSYQSSYCMRDFIELPEQCQPPPRQSWQQKQHYQKA